MEAVEVLQNTEDIRLLLAWDTTLDQARSRRAGAISIAAHVVGIVLLLAVPREVVHPAPEVHHITPLIFPPAELTQKAPNRGKISKSFNVESLLPRPRIQLPPTPPSTTRPRTAELSLPPSPPSHPTALPEPPKIDTPAKDSGPKLPLGMVQAPPPPPQIQVEEKPKLAFETPGAPPSGTGQGAGKVATPTTSVSEAIRSVARGGPGGGIVVGDVGMGEGGIGAGINQPPAPGKQGSNLELLSDPMGVDFRPYLL